MKRKVKLSLKQTNVRVLTNKEVKDLVGAGDLPTKDKPRREDCPYEMEQLLLC